MSGAETKRHKNRISASYREQQSMTKACPKCGRVKFISEFSPKGQYRDRTQRSGYCRPCHSLYQRERNTAYLLRKYGITEAQYQKLFVLQGGVCAICGHPPKTRNLAIEHDHKTGRVRCLACHACNRNKIGTNTLESAEKVVALLKRDFDGRTL